MTAMSTNAGGASASWSFTASAPRTSSCGLPGPRAASPRCPRCCCCCSSRPPTTPAAPPRPRPRPRPRLPFPPLPPAPSAGVACPLARGVPRTLPLPPSPPAPPPRPRACADAGVRPPRPREPGVAPWGARAWSPEASWHTPTQCSSTACARGAGQGWLAQQTLEHGNVHTCTRTHAHAQARARRTRCCARSRSCARRMSCFSRSDPTNTVSSALSCCCRRCSAGSSTRPVPAGAWPLSALGSYLGAKPGCIVPTPLVCARIFRVVTSRTSRRVQALGQLLNTQHTRSQPRWPTQSQGAASPRVHTTLHHAPPRHATPLRTHRAHSTKGFMPGLPL